MSWLVFLFCSYFFLIKHYSHRILSKKTCIYFLVHIYISAAATTSNIAIAATLFILLSSSSSFFPFFLFILLCWQRARERSSGNNTDIMLCSFASFHSLIFFIFIEGPSISAGFSPFSLLCVASPLSLSLSFASSPPWTQKIEEEKIVEKSNRPSTSTITIATLSSQADFYIYSLSTYTLPSSSSSIHEHCNVFCWWDVQEEKRKKCIKNRRERKKNTIMPLYQQTMPFHYTTTKTKKTNLYLFPLLLLLSQHKPCLFPLYIFYFLLFFSQQTRISQEKNKISWRRTRRKRMRKKSCSLSLSPFLVIVLLLRWWWRWEWCVVAIWKRKCI